MHPDDEENRRLPVVTVIPNFEGTSPPVRYCIITAVRDDEQIIVNTIESVLRQAIRPQDWLSWMMNLRIETERSRQVCAEEFLDSIPTREKTAETI